MRFLFCLIISVLFVTDLSAEEILKVKDPSEIHALQDDVPDEIKGLQWNRWTSENFTVLCLDDKQAEYLHGHLELVKSWIYSRWGLYDSNFSVNCKLVCVNDPVLFQKMFGINDSHVEVRRDSSGRITESIIFLLIDDAPSHTIPIPLSRVCLAEFAQKHDFVLDLWARQGMGLLNGSLDQIRAEVVGLRPLLENNEPIYFSQGVLEMTREAYGNLSRDKQLLYDKSAVALCLLIRKEFGQDKFHLFIQLSSEFGPQKALSDVLGFDSYDDFDPTFKRYLIDLSRDIGDRKTPDDYLQIRAKGTNMFAD